MLCVSLCLPGCGGCSDEAEQTEAEKKLAEEKKKQEKPKPDFEAERLIVQPHNLLTVNNLYKPGHWVSTTIDCIANNYDFQGELNSKPIEAKDMPYEIAYSQPLSLAKGQLKQCETHFLVPNRYLAGLVLELGDEKTRRVPWDQQICPPYSLQGLAGDRTMLAPLENHQFFFVVLAGSPQPYRAWSDLPSFHTFGEYATNPNDPLKGSIYQVWAPPVIAKAPLPSMSCGWTPIAYVVWDDLTPEILDAAQQEAMLDWLHWGGQIIISGPSTLNKLQGSFLEKYLPAKSNGTVTFTAEDLQQFEQQEWVSVEDWNQSKAVEWGGEKLQLHPEARAVLRTRPGDSGLPLLAERTVGRGRIVVTAFRLNDPTFQGWMKQNDSFLNSAIMGRPARLFKEDESIAGIDFSWAAEPWAQPNYLYNTQAYNQSNKVQIEPRQTTRVRFFSRDLGPEAFQPKFIRDVINEQRTRSSPGGWGMEEEQATLTHPVAAWDDFNAVSHFAREGLKMSEIRVPDRGFVVWVLGGYLILLVPVNWLFFRLIGRVEWAWIAAPIITVSYTLIVVWSAEVSIGFSRARTEINIVEVQPDYPKAHLTRFTRLYTGLSTSFDLEYTNPTAIAMPFSKGVRLPKFQGHSLLKLKRNQTLQLDDFQVASNSWEMLHSEEMLPLDGSMVFQVQTDELGSRSYQLLNGTGKTIQEATIYFRSANGELSSYLLEKLEPNAAMEFTEDDLTACEAPSIPQQARSYGVDFEEVDRIRELRDLAALSIPRGAWRLVGWSEEPLPGLEISPKVQQANSVNLFVIHLKYPEPDAPARDSNHQLAHQSRDVARPEELNEAFEKP